jgi:hypothetical protein
VAKVAKTGKHVRFHDLRRTAVSLMRDLGVTEGDISATTGHSIATKRRSGNKMETSPPSATPRSTQVSVPRDGIEPPTRGFSAAVGDCPLAGDHVLVKSRESST